MNTWLKKFGSWSRAGIGALVLVLASAMLLPAAISRISGLAVALDVNPTITWNNVRDGAAGDDLANGLLGQALYFWDGSNFDRARGTTTRGLLVDTGNIVGTDFFAIERSNITTASVNLAFGFTSDKALVEAPDTNTQDVCIDWNGGTAACPVANAAGNHRLAPGSSIILDDYQSTSISVIADSGTQTIQVVAWQ